MKTFTPIIADNKIIDYSDGYHTFDELYRHRIVLWIKLVKFVTLAKKECYAAWRSRKHEDGTGFDGWFLLCLEHVVTEEQISYHLPETVWSQCDFAATFDKAPSFDGHTSADVIHRLLDL